MADTAAGSLETPQDAGAGEAGRVRMWLDAIELQEKQEEDWRKAAVKVTERYRMEMKDRKRGFPILYANTETMIPAVFNSMPVPDIRRRFNDADENGKKAAQALERAVSISNEEDDLQTVLGDAVKDMTLVGRGTTRVRYEPMLGKDGASVVYHKATAEHVAWGDIRVGPARRWSKVPWIAFRHLLTRAQLKKLNPTIGAEVPLDHTLDGMKEKDGDKPLPDIFKRGQVWEIWNKDARKVLFIAPAWKSDLLRETDDELKLEGFWPIPRPLYAIWTTDSLIPIEPYRVYQDQAEELDRVTQRIMALIKVCRARGIYDSSLSEAFDKLKTLDDGEFAPTGSDEAKKFTMEAGLDKAVWHWPLETVVKTLEQLYLNRQQIKAVIFELTGIADIMRGETDAQETKGAQQLKTQWGTLRIAPMQQEIQRYARDVIRLKSEIIAEKFDPQTLSMISGIDLVSPPTDPQGQPVMGQDGQPAPNPVAQLLKTEQLRCYRIDIETDSTIRADVARAQEQIGTFIKGLSEWFVAVGPAVEGGIMPADVAIDIASGFARNFKLGKQAEDAFDRWSDQAKEQAKNPQPKPDPEMAKLQMEQQGKQQEMQAKQEMEQQKLQADMQSKAQELELKKAEMAAKLEHEQQMMQLDMQKHQQQMEMDGAKHQADMQMKGQELQMQERQGQVSSQLEAAKIADGQQARQDEMTMREAESKGLPATTKGSTFMETTSDQIKQIVASVEKLAQQVADTHEIATTPVVPVRGKNGRVSGGVKTLKDGRVLQMVKAA